MAHTFCTEPVALTSFCGPDYLGADRRMLQIGDAIELPASQAVALARQILLWERRTASAERPSELGINPPVRRPGQCCYRVDPHPDGGTLFQWIVDSTTVALRFSDQACEQVGTDLLAASQGKYRELTDEVDVDG